MNILQQFEQKHLQELTKGKEIPKFQAGDTLKIHVKVTEGERERTQLFEGVCIARRNAGLNSSFTVRKISHGEGVERIFSLYSPQVEKIEITKHGDVRRAKLYYLRGRSGKSARIKEKSLTARTKDSSAKPAPKKAKAEKPAAAKEEKKQA